MTHLIRRGRLRDPISSFPNSHDTLPESSLVLSDTVAEQNECHRLTPRGDVWREMRTKRFTTGRFGEIRRSMGINQRRSGFLEIGVAFQPVLVKLEQLT